MYIWATLIIACRNNAHGARSAVRLILIIAQPSEIKVRVVINVASRGHGRRDIRIIAIKLRASSRGGGGRVRKGEIVQGCGVTDNA